MLLAMKTRNQLLVRFDPSIVTVKQSSIVLSSSYCMLFPGQKPSSSYSLLKFVYVSSQLCHSLVVHPLLRDVLDPPCRFNANLLCLFVECGGSGICE